MTHPLAALIAGVKVKPLAWEVTDWSAGDGVKGENDCEWTGNNPFNVVYIIDWLGAGEFRVTLHDHAVFIRGGGLDAAKAAAQADYEARILAALEAAPVPDLVVVVNKVTAIVEDWESQAGERDPRDPIKSQIYEEASAIRALIALATAQAAQIAGLTKALETKDANRRFIIDERDRTFSLMVKRAEASEAKVAELEGILAALEGKANE